MATLAPHRPPGRPPCYRPVRRRRWLGWIAAAAAIIGVLLIAAINAVLMVTESPGDVEARPGCVSALAPPGGGDLPPGAQGQWTPDQRQNAAAIVAAGQQAGAPPRAQWIALATAMQEAALSNLDYGDRDSLGLFQQRPSQGWGSPAQLQDPAYAAARFYQELLAVPGWDAMPLTQAAQTVQRSAFPAAYAKWEQAAADLLAELGGGATGLSCGPATVAAGAAGAALDWAGQQLGKPYEWGATGPDTFDCSGLTLRAWQSAGVQLPRTSREQARAGGQQIPRAQAQPGDLLFWSSGGGVAGVHHVALYLGDNRIREAAATGIPVRDRAIGGSYDERELLPFAIRPGAAA
ncbi:MAG: C40 family peptidase [Pseudonocardia sp.]|nr:C40 family peptidase [Pseudonocardia sp.]